MFLPILRVAAAVLLLTVWPAVGAAQTFTKLFDTTLVVGQNDPIFTYGLPQLGRTHAVVLGAAPGGHSFLLSTPITGGQVKVLADTRTRVPGGTGTFTTSHLGYLTAFQPPNCSSPAVGSTHVVFVGRDGAGLQGLYSVPIRGGKVRRLADYRTRIPGGPVGENTTFNVNYSFCNVSVAGSRVVFDAGLAGVYQISVSGTGLRRIADANTPTTPAPFEVAKFSHPSADGRRTVYVGSTVFGPYALYEGPAALNKRPVAVGTPSPIFDSFAVPDVKGRSVLFHARNGGQSFGLFRVSPTGGPLAKVVDLARKPPANAPGDRFGSITNEVGAFATDGRPRSLSVFRAVTTDGTTSWQGLYGACGTRIFKIHASGDQIEGIAYDPLQATSRIQVAKAGARTVARTAFTGLSGRYLAVFLVTLPVCR